MNRYGGLIAAVHSPFDAHAELRLDAVEKQAELLGEARVSGVFVAGTTGESLSLTDGERMRLAERWCAVVGGHLPVMVHVGHTSVQSARELARQAAGAGASAIAAMAPPFFRPPDVGSLVELLSSIASEAPGVPFFYYDIPDWTGVRLPIEDVVAMSRDRIPTFAGVKFTSDDMVGLQRSFDVPGDHQMLFGRDEQLLAGLVMGCRAAVGSTYNFAAPIYHQVIDALARGDLDEARQAQRRSADLVRVLERFGGLRAGKAIMAMLGVDCGPVRSPLKPLTPVETAELVHELAPLDVFVRRLGGAATADDSE